MMVSHYHDLYGDTVTETEEDADTGEAVSYTHLDKKVLLALSGGVDSSVVAALLLKAIGNNLVCVHVNQDVYKRQIL